MIKFFFTMIIIFAFLPHKLMANEARVFYFNSANGDEIKAIAKRDTSGIIQYTFTVPENINPHNAFYDFVYSTMNQENYEYFGLRPCFDCHESYSFEESDNIEDSKLLSRNEPVVERRTIKSKQDLANILLESIANNLGNRSVNAVFDAATQNQTSESSQFQVITIGNDRKPIGLCLITQSSCDTMNDVSAMSLGGSQFGFEISKVSEMDRWKRVREIEAAIERYARSKRYQCRVVVTNSGDGDVKQIVCFPSY